MAIMALILIPVLILVLIPIPEFQLQSAELLLFRVPTAPARAGWL